mmetsp:Transcript_21706/g.47988  ORF Transcript_21706/g.47988 Transcript_21706/m.47988 type:complete len:227 (+) Transcript_21706:786-1466(+)
MARIAKHPAPSRQQGVGNPVGLAPSLVADHCAMENKLEPSEVGADAFIAACRRLPTGTRDSDSVWPALIQPHARPVAGHIGDVVCSWIMDLVQQLLCHGCWADHAVCPRWFREDEMSTGFHLHNGKADVNPAVNGAPVCEKATRALCTALKQMSCKGALRELVKILSAPAELMDERPEDESRVHHAASDDNVASISKSLRNGEGAQVGIGCDRPFRKRQAAEHLHD